MTRPLVSIINQSEHLSSADAEKMTHAVGRQLAEHVSPYHGWVPAVEYVLPGGTPTPGGCSCYIIDKPDVAGVAGYHSETVEGIPYAKVFAGFILDQGGSVMGQGFSISQVLSHELVEMAGDLSATIWSDGGKDVYYAYELCDAVESDTYEIDGVHVSNFVLRAFFDPRAEKGSRFDFLGRLSRPLTMTSGGYMTTRVAGPIANIFASRPGYEGDDSFQAPTTVEAGSGLYVHFGPDVPEWKRAGKVLKTAMLRGR